MGKLVLNRRRFLTWYFLDANFNDHIFDALMTDREYSLDINDLLICVGNFPASILEDGQVYEADEYGYINYTEGDFTLEVN